MAELESMTPETFVPPIVEDLPWLPHEAREDAITTVKVGPNAKPYVVHKALLRRSSENLDRALGGGFREGIENSINVDDVQEHIFNIYVDWLHERGLTNDIRASMKASDVIDVYVFADAYVVPQLKRTMIDCWLDRWGHCVPDYLEIISAFTRLPESSGLCKLFVDLYLEGFHLQADIGLDGEIERRQELPREFLVQMFIGFAAKTAGSRKLQHPKDNRCKYHEHPDETLGQA